MFLDIIIYILGIVSAIHLVLVFLKKVEYNKWLIIVLVLFVLLKNYII